MSHSEKLEYFGRDCVRRGLAPGAYKPPVFRVLWAVGIKLPPPIFLGFLTNMTLATIYYTLGCSVLLWFIYWRYHPTSFLIAAIWSIGMGSVFGLLVAWGTARKTRLLKLPRWSRYPDTGEGKTAM
jgi:hypothetical protein